MGSEVSGTQNRSSSIDARYEPREAAVTSVTLTLVVGADHPLVDHHAPVTSCAGSTTPSADVAVLLYVGVGVRLCGAVSHMSECSCVSGRLDGDGDEVGWR